MDITAAATDMDSMDALTVAVTGADLSGAPTADEDSPVVLPDVVRRQGDMVAAAFMVEVASVVEVDPTAAEVSALEEDSMAEAALTEVAATDVANRLPSVEP